MVLSSPWEIQFDKMKLLIVMVIAIFSTVSGFDELAARYGLVCGVNEYIPECVPCPPINCGDKTGTICTKQCTPNNRCYCLPGHLRNYQGICVKAAECGCGENEYIPQCVPCGPRNCDNKNETSTCDHKICTPNNQCFCKSGYLRNQFGSCVTQAECACGKNEYIPECFPCPPYICGDSYNVPCPFTTCMKNDLCYCKREYLRNIYGECVKPSECTIDYAKIVEKINNGQLDESNSTQESTTVSNKEVDDSVTHDTVETL